MTIHRQRKGARTRSQAAAPDSSMELPRFSDGHISTPDPVDFSPVLVLDPGATCFTPASRSVSHADYNSDHEQYSSCDDTKHADTHESSTYSKTLPKPPPMPPIPKEVPLADETLPKIDYCNQTDCSYYDGYAIDNISDNPAIDLNSCEICNRNSRYSTLVCKRCLDCGAHKGHTPWMRMRKT